MRRYIVSAAAVVVLCGCLTVSQSEFPVVEMTPAAESSPVVALSGFEATVTRYVPIYGYTTVWNSTPGYYRHGRYRRGYDYPETVSTTTYIPQVELTTAYAEKAQDLAAKAGYVVSATNATCLVDVKFAGPRVTDNDRMAEFGSMLFTAFLSDYTASAWSARLRVTETATGRVLFSRDYTQEYSAWSVGLVPLFSPLSAETVQTDYIQNWCLSALTDRAMADVTAFLATLPKKK